MELKKIQLWGEATRRLANVKDMNTDVLFLSSIINDNNTIPVIWADDKLNIISSRNIDPELAKDLSYMKEQISIMSKQHDPIKLSIENMTYYIFYKDSPLLDKLRLYFYFQIVILTLFLLISFFAFSNKLKAAKEKEMYILQQNLILEKKVQTRTQQLSDEKEHSESLLLNILPSEIAEELKITGKAKAKSFDLATVMFTDFQNFTKTSEELSTEELVTEINLCYSEFDKIITEHNIEKIKTIGDSYMAAGGLPVVNKTHASDTILAALAIQRFMEQYKIRKQNEKKPYFEIRIGIHTGPVVAGIVGVKKFAYDIWGDTVNIASRMESTCEVGKVNVSGTSYEMVKDKFQCTYRGKVEAKNKGLIDMYFVDYEI